MINKIDDIDIQLNQIEKDRLLLNLLISSIVKNQIAIEQTLKLKLKIEYGESLTNEIIDTELKKIDQDFVKMQYDLIADVLSKYSSKSENTNQVQSIQDKFSIFINSFQSLMDELVKQLPGKDQSQLFFL